MEVSLIKQECLQLTKQDSAESQGDDFDKCYIGQQIGAHVNMMAELRGIEDFTNPQLQQVIQESELTAEKTPRGSEADHPTT